MPLINDKSRKWIIAIIMSFLMVAFALPSWFGSKDPRAGNPVRATVFGTEKVTENELATARQEWGVLTSRGVSSRGGFGESLPLALEMVAGDLRRLENNPRELYSALQFASRVLGEISEKPELFALLKREAMHAGIRPNPDRVASVMANAVSPEVLKNPESARVVQQAVASMVSVEALLQQSGSALKVTRPEVSTLLARNFQSLRVTVAVVDAGAMREGVAAPTDEQVQGLFAKYAGARAGEPVRATNPFGFGYLQGDRVRIDYIAVPRAEVIAAAKAVAANYTYNYWEVEAQQYYLKNQGQFTVEGALPDLSNPASRPASSGAASSGAASQPAVRPFAEVSEQIYRKLYDQAADKLAAQVQRRILGVMSADAKAAREAVAKKQPLPASSLGPAYDGYDYLRALAARVEQEFKVRAGVTTFGDRYYSVEELGRVEGIGASIVTATGMTRGVPFAQWVVARARPLYEANANTRQPGLQPIEVLEPVHPAVDATGTVYVARLLDARAARTPELAEVANAVRNDAMTVAAQDAAVAFAKRVAAERPEDLLISVANANRLKYEAVANLRSVNEVPAGLGLSEASAGLLVDGAFGLLRPAEGGGSATQPGAAHPRAVVSLPQDRKVAIVELNEVDNQTPQEDPARLELRVLAAIQNQNRNLFAMAFFSPEAILARTEFTPEPGYHSELVPTTKPAGK